MTANIVRSVKRKRGEGSAAAFCPTLGSGIRRLLPENGLSPSPRRFTSPVPTSARPPACYSRRSTTSFSSRTCWPGQVRAWIVIVLRPAGRARRPSGSEPHWRFTYRCASGLVAMGQGDHGRFGGGNRGLQFCVPGADENLRTGVGRRTSVPQLDGIVARPHDVDLEPDLGRGVGPAGEPVVGEAGAGKETQAAAEEGLRRVQCHRVFLGVSYRDRKPLQSPGGNVVEPGLVSLAQLRNDLRQLLGQVLLAGRDPPACRTTARRTRRRRWAWPSSRRRARGSRGPAGTGAFAPRPDSGWSRRWDCA